LSSNLNSNLEVLFSKMENFVASKTVVGEALHIGNVIVVPLMDISLGVAAAASEANSKKENGLGGLGAKITPSSVLVIQNDSVNLINIKNQDSISKLIDLVPNLFSKINLCNKKD